MTTDQKSDRKQQEVERFVGQLAPTPARWIHSVSCMPMWGTVFRVIEGLDRQKIEELRTHLNPQEWDTESIGLAAAGWQEVGDTGILALEYDGELLLGIHGAGYDFYENHWTPLYDALGYEWDTSE